MRRGRTDEVFFKKTDKKVTEYMDAPLPPSYVKSKYNFFRDVHIVYKNTL